MSTLKKIYQAFINGPIYIVVFGLVFFGIGASLSVKQSLIERFGDQAPGEVVSLSTRCDDDGCTYSPVVRFKTQYGITFSFESRYFSNPPAYKAGDRVTVIYPQENPEEAEIKGGGKVFRLIFTIVGGIITSFGLGFFYTTLRDDLSSP